MEFAVYFRLIKSKREHRGAYGWGMGMAMDSGEFLMHTYPTIGKVNEA
jgi:hypothetical protein